MKLNKINDNEQMKSIFHLQNLHCDYFHYLMIDSWYLKDETFYIKMMH